MLEKKRAKVSMCGDNTLPGSTPPIFQSGYPRWGVLQNTMAIPATQGDCPEANAHLKETELGLEMHKDPTLLAS